MGHDVQNILILLGFLAIMVTGSRYVVKRGHEASDARRRRLAMLERLVDKAASAEDLVAFARSPEGRQFLAAADTPATNQRRILRLLQSGVLLVAVGIALLVNAARFVPESGPAVSGPSAEAGWWGTMSLCLGLGLLAIGAISCRLGEKWGLLDSRGREQNPAR